MYLQLQDTQHFYHLNLFLSLPLSSLSFPLSSSSSLLPFSPLTEAMFANIPRELGRLVYKFGGDPVASFFSSEVLKPSVAKAMFVDATHDNEPGHILVINKIYMCATYMYSVRIHCVLCLYL